VSRIDIPVGDDGSWHGCLLCWKERYELSEP
jgi:hypothetical protein